MTPQNKANELLLKFFQGNNKVKLSSSKDYKQAKCYATIAADQIMLAFKESGLKWDEQYWKEVRYQITKL